MFSGRSGFGVKTTDNSWSRVCGTWIHQALLGGMVTCSSSWIFWEAQMGGNDWQGSPLGSVNYYPQLLQNVHPKDARHAVHAKQDHEGSITGFLPITLARVMYILF